MEEGQAGESGTGHDDVIPRNVIPRKWETTEGFSSQGWQDQVHVFKTSL